MHLRFAFASLIFLAGTALADIAPALAEINLGPVPIDKYLSLNQRDTGEEHPIPSCPENWTVQTCIRWIFNDSPLNYKVQGIRGVRFFFALGGGTYSTPFTPDGRVCDGTPSPADCPKGNWVQKLGAFLSDLRSYGVERVAMVPVVMGEWGAKQGSPFAPVVRPDVPARLAGYQLRFLKWLPYGINHLPGCKDCYDGLPDGYQINSAYNDAAATPSDIFWGWGPLLNLIDVVLQKARDAQLDVPVWEIETEVFMSRSTVQARLVYDNTHELDVMGAIRQKMAAKGFNPERVTISVASDTPVG